MPSSLNGTPGLRGAFAYCRWLTRSAHSHFPLSFLLLSPARRRAMHGVYAYCRAIDDVVDRDGADPRQAQEELNRWRAELARCQTGAPAHPIAVALTKVQREYAIPPEYFEQLIRGVEMDLHRKRYDTFEELKVYCQHVASVVGLICVRVFGCTHRASDRYATDLGVALQLTNILRDLKSDTERGRVYLPQRELRHFGCSEEALLKGELTPAVRELLAFQTRRAREYFRSAGEALRASGEGRRLLPARIMGRVYARILRRIERSEFDVFSRRISVPMVEQLWLAAQCMWW